MDVALACIINATAATIAGITATNLIASAAGLMLNVTWGCAFITTTGAMDTETVQTAVTKNPDALKCAPRHSSSATQRAYVSAVPVVVIPL
jgi:hypothetical protein